MRDSDTQTKNELVSKLFGFQPLGALAGIICGLTAYIALTILLLQHPVLSNVSLGANDHTFLGFSVAGASNALAFLFLAILYGQKRVVPHGASYIACVFAVLSIATVSQYFLGFGKISNSGFISLCGICFGVCLALLSVEIMRCLALLNSQQIAASLVVAMAVLGAVLLLSSVLDPAGITILEIFLIGLLAMSLRATVGKKQNLYRWGSKSSIQVPKKLLVTILVQGVSTGVIHGAFASAADLGFFRVEAISFFFVCVISFVFLFRLHRDLNYLLYIVAFPLMALGHLGLVALFNTTASSCMHEIGYRFCMLLSWLIAAWVMRHKKLSANWVWPCIMCAFAIGRCVGVGIGMFAELVLDYRGAVVVQAVMIFIVLFSALMLFGSATLGDGWGLTVAVPRQDEKVKEHNEILERLSCEFKLTPRETEIASLLAKGRDQAFIGEALHISVDTVKTHRRNIYHKLGIHSHQELLSLMEHIEANIDKNATIYVARNDNILPR